MNQTGVFAIQDEWFGEIDRSLIETTARWAETEVTARRLECGEDYDALIAPAQASLLVEIGLQSLLVAEDDGGSGLDAKTAATTICAVVEQIAVADVGIAFCWANQMAIQAAGASHPLLAPVFGGAETALASLVLPDFGEGERIDGLAAQVVATTDANGWVLSGSGIRPQCAGRDAKLFGVVAAAGGVPALFAVPADSPGVSIGEAIRKTGLSASRNADLALDGVRLGAEAQVFAGEAAYRALCARYLAFAAAACSGAMLAGYAIARDWAESRVIKGRGQVFKDNPLVASLLGTIGQKTATGRLLVFDVARMLSAPDVYGEAGSRRNVATAHAVFRTVSENAIDALNGAMELMASAGYATEWNLERYWRDVLTVQTTLGPQTEALAAIARHAFGSEGV